ncbi:MAG: hypothetical protein IJA90_11505 [Peptococcaceae bacterium]|nr:hypothetical protein [Peptococcaceae bacterium]
MKEKIVELQQNMVLTTKNFIGEFFELVDNDTVEKGFNVIDTLNDNVENVQKLLLTVEKLWIQSLLQGLSIHDDSNDAVKKLHRYVSNNSRRAEYVAAILRQALLSNSHAINTLMGIYLASVSEKNRDITQEDLIIYDALSIFNDFDVRNYKIIYEITKKEPFEAREGLCVNNEILSNREDYEYLSLTMNKAARVGLFSELSVIEKEENGMVAAIFGSSYKINYVGEAFYNLTAQLDDEMLCSTGG